MSVTTPIPPDEYTRNVAESLARRTMELGQLEQVYRFVLGGQTALVRVDIISEAKADDPRYQNLSSKPEGENCDCCNGSGKKAS